MWKLHAADSRDPHQRCSQPFSRQTLDKHARITDATVTESVCPYCAVGCGQLIHSKGGQVINVEGNPRSPINEGTLCPKGANTLQLAQNPHRQKEVLYRAPNSTKWEKRSLEWTLDTLAQRVYEARERGFKEADENGLPLNHLPTIGTLGGATLDNEENYLIKKLFGGGLGVVSVENQARI